MNTYTIKDLHTIWNERHYLSLDRFVHYFTLRFGYTEKDAIAAYKVFSEFPKHVYGDNEEMQEKLDKLIPLALQLVGDLQTAWEQNSQLKNIEYTEKEIRKLIYSKDGEIKEVVLNLHAAEDIITYAELLKQGIEQKALLRKCCDVKIENTDKWVDIFEGDFFNTNDNWYGVKSNVYVAQKNETFKKLLYIKGKGYVINGELNYDEGRFTPYVLRTWVKLGNVTMDLVKLTDDGVGEQD
jgi:hypothetical protein